MKKLGISKLSVFIIYLLLAGINSRLAAVSNTQGQAEDLQKGRVIVTRCKSSDERVLGGKAMGIIDAPIDKVWMAISDYNHMYQFMPNLPVTFLVDKGVLDEVNEQSHWNRQQFEVMLQKHKIDTLSGDTVYFYNVLAMPFPIADRWYLLEMKREPEQYAVEWRLLIGNMVTNEGSWELERFGDHQQQTLAIYTTFSDLGLLLPGFIINMAMKKTLPGVIEGLRDRIQWLDRE